MEDIWEKIIITRPPSRNGSQDLKGSEYIKIERSSVYIENPSKWHTGVAISINPIVRKERNEIAFTKEQAIEIANTILEMANRL